MTQANFQPDWVCAPSETIKALLQKNNLVPEELASSMDVSSDCVDGLLEGTLSIDQALAERLSIVLGVSARFWLAREEKYQMQTLVVKKKSEENQRRQWVRDLPYAEMVKLGCVKKCTKWQDKFQEAMSFFASSSIAEWQSSYGRLASVAVFRTSAAFVPDAGAVAAWIRIGEIRAEGIEGQGWDSKKFASALSEIRTLTKNKNGKFVISRLSRICIECGVVLIICPSPKGCRASGCARELPDGRRMILMSLRHKTDDHFWFTFFHEAAHLLLHDLNDVPIDGPNLFDTEDQMEIEANSFASDVLVPSDQQFLLQRKPENYKSVLRLATQLGLGAAVVVGQLQHRKIIGYDRYNFLKSKGIWNAINSPITLETE